MNETVQIISTVGFPIACVIFMGWFYYKILSGMNTTLVLLRESVEDLKKSIDLILNKRGDNNAED